MEKGGERRRGGDGPGTMLGDDRKGEISSVRGRGVSQRNPENEFIRKGMRGDEKRGQDGLGGKRNEEGAGRGA